MNILYEIPQTVQNKNKYMNENLSIPMTNAYEKCSIHVKNTNLTILIIIEHT